MISDPQALRALAHPVRLAALSYLQQHGPATATQLSEHVGATPSVTSWHMRHLASFGLVTDADLSEVTADRRQRWWKASARGFALDVGEDPDSQDAGRSLLAELVATAESEVSRWLAEVEPGLGPQWRRRAGPSNTLITVSAQELADLADQINDLLAPYVGRDPVDTPSGARRVRMIRYYLPQLPEHRPSGPR